MPLFIKVSMWASIFSLAVKLLCLSFADYPRTLKFARWEDALSVAGLFAWVAWAWLIVYR